MSNHPRILHPRLAAIIATLRHGEMVFLADAGSGTTPKSLVPLDDGVEYIDVSVAEGLPTTLDLARVLCANGDFEGAIVAEEQTSVNPEVHAGIEEVVGVGNVHSVPYLLDFYKLRNRCKVMVQTGDYGVHTNMVLIAGYPSPPIPMEWLVSSEWHDTYLTEGEEI